MSCFHWLTLYMLTKNRTQGWQKKVEIKVLNKKIVRAWINQDEDAMIASTSEDYMYLYPDGFVTRDDLIGKFKKAWAGKSWSDTDFRLLLETKM